MKKRLITSLLTVMLTITILFAGIIPVFTTDNTFIPYGGKKHGIASLITRQEKCKPENVRQFDFNTHSRGGIPFASIGLEFEQIYETYTGRVIYNWHLGLEQTLIDAGYPYVRYGASIQYAVSKSGVTKEQIKAVNEQYAATRKPGYQSDWYAPIDDYYIPASDWLIDSWFSDYYTACETAVNPFYVIGINLPKLDRGWSAYESAVILFRLSVEELDAWGYTDEYWVDYYNFLLEMYPICNTQYIIYDNFADKQDNIIKNVMEDSHFETPATSIVFIYYESYSETPTEAELMMEGKAGITVTGAEYKAAIEKRLALYKNRLKNPYTGDTLPAAAGVWFAAAMLSLAVPASLAVITKRRKNRISTTGN